MSCRRRLRRELQWGQWPSNDFTLDENRADLLRHQSEFENGVAFAYSVLQPDLKRCLGCVYIESCDTGGGAQLAYWVIDDARDIESNLVSETVSWLHSEWMFDRVVIPIRNENVRGISLAASLGFTPFDSPVEAKPSGYRYFICMKS